MNKLKKRILALGMSIVMTLTMIPMFGSLAFADEAASTITVYLTISNKGELAKANDGTVMAWKPVTVTDLDEDGTFTFDEALVAAHKAYNTEEGYAVTDSGWVLSLWGDSEAGVYSFMDNDEATDVVTAAEIKADDFLVAAVDADATYYYDYYTFFGDRFLSAFAGQDITFSVNGFAAMMGGDSEAIAGLTIGYFTSDGTYVALEKTTDENGAVTITFDEPGTYCVSAAGVVKDVSAIDWTTYEEVTIEAPIIAPACLVTVTGEYTEKDVNFIAADGSQFGMFSAGEGTTAVIKGDEVVVHYVLNTTKKTYVGLHKGLITDIPKDGSIDVSIYNDITINDDMTIDFSVSKDLCGKMIPIAPIKANYGAGKNSVIETWTSGDQYFLAIPAEENLAYALELTNNVKMFKPEALSVSKEGDGYVLHLTMGSESMDKVFVGYAIAATDDAAIDIALADGKGFVEIPVESLDEPIVLAFRSASNKGYYNRTLTVDLEAKTAVFDPTQITIEQFDGVTTEDAVSRAKDNTSVDLVNALIEAIQVQARDENTDKYCTIAKAYYDALSDEDKEKLDDPGYFGDDTGDASKDDPRNQDEIGEKELLVVSFGTSFNGSRVATIKAVEDALAEAYPEYSVRRAFTAQIIINHIQSRDGEAIDNMEQALDRAVANNVKELVVQPTHLMHGAEYDEMCEALKAYEDKFDKIIISEPLLNTDEDKTIVAKAVAAAAIEASGFDSLEAADAAKTALVFMGHGTEHKANVTYEEMQAIFDGLGYKNVFVGTVEGLPESTEVNTVLKKVQDAGYTKVILRPLMVVAGDHANNDMADTEDEESWASIFGAALGADNVTCQINGLGEIAEVQQVYVAHVKDAIGEEEVVSFNDVKEGDWFYEVVNDIAKVKNTKGSALMGGYKDGSGNFGPADPLQRQDFAVILYRLAEEPAVEAVESGFPDADTAGYYYTSVVWAKENKVITGYDNGKFGVGDNITREQVATILYRFAKEVKDIDTTAAKGDLSKFKDAKAVSEFAKDALTWANGAGIITGKADGTIDPQGNAARAEIAAMVLRYLEYERGLGSAEAK